MSPPKSRLIRVVFDATSGDYVCEDGSYLEARSFYTFPDPYDGTPRIRVEPGLTDNQVERLVREYMPKAKFTPEGRMWPAYFNLLVNMRPMYLLRFFALPFGRDAKSADTLTPKLLEARVLHYYNIVRGQCGTLES